MWDLIVSVPNHCLSLLLCYSVDMVSSDVIMKSSVLHPSSDSRNWPRSSEWVKLCLNFQFSNALRIIGMVPVLK